MFKKLHLMYDKNFINIFSLHFIDIGDKLIEVVGLENCLHMGQVRTGLRSSGKRLAQCSSLIIKTKKKFPMQVDGEPWCQVPCTVRFNHLECCLDILEKIKQNFKNM